MLWYEEMRTGIGKNLINRENISGKVKDWDYPGLKFMAQVWRCRLKKSHLHNVASKVMSDTVQEEKNKDGDGALINVYIMLKNKILNF